MVLAGICSICSPWRIVTTLSAISVTSVFLHCYTQPLELKLSCAQITLANCIRWKDAVIPSSNKWASVVLMLEIVWQECCRQVPRSAPANSLHQLVHLPTTTRSTRHDVFWISFLLLQKAAKKSVAAFPASTVSIGATVAQSSYQSSDDDTCEA